MQDRKLLEEEARAILRDRGLEAIDLTLADGFANNVLLTEQHVIRLNSGRFPQAFAHEARVLQSLPGSLPHPSDVSLGQRQGGGEFLVLERLPSTNLETAWASLHDTDRIAIAQQLATYLRMLHELPKAAWMNNPWVAGALSAHRWRDAYHAPVETIGYVVASALTMRPDARDTLNRIHQFVADRAAALVDGPTGFIHTDIHFRNILVHEGSISGLIDFEGSRWGSLDIELDMLLRTLASNGGAPDDGKRLFLSAFKEGYPALFAHPHLVARLEVFELQWHLTQIHNWQSGDAWTVDPVIPIETVLRGNFAARIHDVLA